MVDFNGLACEDGRKVMTVFGKEKLRNGCDEKGKVVGGFGGVLEDLLDLMVNLGQFFRIVCLLGLVLRGLRDHNQGLKVAEMLQVGNLSLFRGFHQSFRNLGSFSECLKGDIIVSLSKIHNGEVVSALYGFQVGFIAEF